MKWIDAGDIKSWITGKQRHCADTMPELLRRLIFATASTIEEIDFPSGDSIAVGEWDGRLKTPVVSPFFPQGYSGWEISTKTSPGSKADEDYRKRVADPRGLKKNETTFVFVTPRIWRGRMKWQGDKRNLGDWKDIRVIGPDAIEQWLESAPAVALWLADKMEKIVPGGIRAIETFWEEWSLSTTPPLSPNIVLSGRAKESERVRDWLSHSPNTLEVQGDSPDEAFAFLFSAINAMPDDVRTKALARCVIVENIGEFRQCVQAFQQNPLIIAAPGECSPAAGAAVAKGHHVFLSMDSTVIDVGPILRLSRPQANIIENELRQTGLSEVKAQQLSRDFGRSIPVLRRGLSQSRAVSAPLWANAVSAKLILPVLLAGSWSDEKTGDRRVIEKLSSMKYEDFMTELGKFLPINDSPIRKVGNVWMIKSSLDAWFLVARHLTQDWLQLFNEVTRAVLTKTDPKFELPVDQRWAAAIYGKSNEYSEMLRRGLAESLILLAVYKDRAVGIDAVETSVNKTVKEILVPVNTWEDWASLKDITPLLAEAAPDTFMQQISEHIKGNPEPYKDLMRDGVGGVFGECNHSGLLWALEALGWNPSYFFDAVNLLQELASIDPGGRWHNRPAQSLHDIFFPGLPQTYAPPQERLKAFDALVAKDPKMVWEFTKGFYSSGSMTESYRFQWRDAGGSRRGLQVETGKPYQEYVAGLLPRLKDLACLKENIVSATDEFTHLPSETKDQLLSTLLDMDPGSFTKEEISELLQKTREAMNWITGYGDKELKVYLVGLGKVLDKFAPKDVLDRVGWLLLNPWPRLPDVDSRQFEDHEARVKMAQEQAAREILDQLPLGKIIEFSRTVSYPDVLGSALGRIIKDEKEDHEVTEAILNEKKNTNLIKGYARGRVASAGSEWIEKKVEEYKASGPIQPETLVLLYFGLHENPETWRVVSKLGPAFEKGYWKNISSFIRAANAEDASFAIEKSLDVKRFDTALSVAGDPSLSIPSKILQRLIQELIAQDPEESGFRADTMEEFHLGHIFNQLYERNELPLEEIAKLEWPFAPILDEIRRYTSQPLAIHRLLQKDPSLFAQLVSFMYKREDGSSTVQDGVPEDKQKAIWKNAHEVLDHWHLIPGLKPGNVFDEKELIGWAEAARKQYVQSGHKTGGDLQLAFMLSHAPTDPDGVWPHTAVRNLIEQLSNDVIDEHIRIGLYNSRGVTSRGVTDGGDQERKLSMRYKEMSMMLRSKWPRTSAILQAMSESYESDAKREDTRADLFDLR